MLKDEFVPSEQVAWYFQALTFQALIIEGACAE
jgi:hypothetical protein